MPAHEERTELLALLRDLTDEEWDAPSLCTEWIVRDVATHIVSYDELSVPTLVGTFLRGGIKVSGCQRWLHPRSFSVGRQPPIIEDVG